MGQKDVIEKLIAELRWVVTRPALFMGETTTNAAQTFLSGFSTAYHAVGVTPNSDLRREATYSRRWEYGPSGGVNSMRERGLTEEQIVQELLLIEIKMLELVAEGMQD